jgi:hypothetical protein
MQPTRTKLWGLTEAERPAADIGGWHNPQEEP